MTPGGLSLVAKHVATTYVFRPLDGAPGWALCTVNDATGELLITSDWGNWSHRWNPSPQSLGTATLTAFIGSRGSVDYLARKLQSEGRGGRRWSADATARELRRLLCEARLVDGRESKRPRVSTPCPGRDEDPLSHLTRAKAREIWDELGECADEVGENSDLFFDRVLRIDGFSDYVTEEPWEHGQTEQTAGDRALREVVLPALIAACRGAASEAPAPVGQPDIDAPISRRADPEVDWEALVERANAARRLLDDKPRHQRRGYVLAPGSILNAYREGDLSFTEARDVLASVKFREATERTEVISNGDRRGQVPDAGRDTVDLLDALAATVAALGTVMREMKRRELLSMLPTRERERRLRESAMIAAEVGELASRAFEEGTLALVRSGHPDAVMSTGKISLEEAARLPENRDTSVASEES